ncbi:MAG: redox-sensing transcriptional repressor Rex [Bacteroidales bacterium]|jgi:redox-sensing transcriptional repressor|nr:redox-sensing transcriptional repressor Rex [Bacteroidales bacterium]
MDLPGRTVERLSEYRRTLLAYLDEDKQFIYSHDLAARLHITAVQVRRDLMLIGHTSILRKGYEVQELINAISRIIDSEETVNVAVIGAGNFGRAIAGYFKGKRSKLNLVASFDSDPLKANKIISGVKCHPYSEAEKLIGKLNIQIAILTVPPEFAMEIADDIVRFGIKGILNFTTISLNVPHGVHLEEYDMLTSMEKVAYFVKENNAHRHTANH